MHCIGGEGGIEREASEEKENFNPLAPLLAFQYTMGVLEPVAAILLAQVRE